MSAAQLAEGAEKTRATVHRVLNGEIDPPYSTVLAYWAVLQSVRGQSPEPAAPEAC